MNLESVKIVSFSPTGTSRAVARAIARGIGLDALETVDITRPAVRTQPLAASGDELLIVAVPVYMGRVPAVASEWLQTMQLQGTPTVCVVVYGNRAFEDALLELKNIVTASGGVPVALGAYIGEHSFSNEETPVAPGRPDAEDLRHAEGFGRAIRAKLDAAAGVADLADVVVPGEFPYRKDTKLWSVDFIAVSDACIHCGICAEVCPMGAVDREDSAKIDQELCITCCACIKSCPQGARSRKPGPVADAGARLHSLLGEPKQPENFL